MNWKNFPMKNYYSTKLFKKSQNLCNIEQPLQAPCLPSGGPQKLRNPFQVISSTGFMPAIFLNFWYSKDPPSLNVCFNFACLFELKNVSFCSLCLRKWQMLLLSKYPQIFTHPASSIRLRNTGTGTRLAAKHQIPFISLTFSWRTKKMPYFVRKILLIIMR